MKVNSTPINFLNVPKNRELTHLRLIHPVEIKKKEIEKQILDAKQIIQAHKNNGNIKRAKELQKMLDDYG